MSTERLTTERCNGIRTGYWSPAKKEELVQKLARYENIDDDPGQLRLRLLRGEDKVIPPRIPEYNAGFCIIAGEIYATELPKKSDDGKLHIYSIVLGVKIREDGTEEYVTWDCRDDDCNHGHYWDNKTAARSDYHTRLMRKYRDDI